MTNKIKKFLYTLEHLIPDGYDEIPTFALYHPLLLLGVFNQKKALVGAFSVIVISSQTFDNLRLKLYWPVACATALNMEQQGEAGKFSV